MCFQNIIDCLQPMFLVYSHLSVVSSPLSVVYSPLSVVCNPLSVVCSPLSIYNTIQQAKLAIIPHSCKVLGKK